MIDAHAHQVPPDLRDRLAADGERLGVRLRSDGRVEFASGEITRPMAPGLFAPQPPAGCDLQIVSPWVDLFGYGLDVERGARWARLLNTAAAGRPALATVPLQEGRAAAVELHWALGHGLLGVEIGTNVRGCELSDPSLEPFWAACAEARAPVFFHPAYTIPTPRVEAYYLHNLVANPLGADRVLLGTGIPFDMGDPAPLDTLDRAGVGARDRQAIIHDNAAALFRIGHGATPFH